jgi:hypothetical protein
MARALFAVVAAGCCWLLLSPGVVGQTLPASRSSSQPATAASSPTFMPISALASPEALLAHLKTAPAPPAFPATAGYIQQREARGDFAQLGDAWWALNEPSGREIVWTLQVTGLAPSSMSKEMILQLQSPQQHIRVLATAGGGAALPAFSPGETVKLKGAILSAPRNPQTEPNVISVVVRSIERVKAP